jgi:hypothetical protein
VAKGASNLKRTNLSFKHLKVAKPFFKIKSLIISVSIFPFLFSGGSVEFSSLLFSISNILINSIILFDYKFMDVSIYPL